MFYSTCTMSSKTQIPAGYIEQNLVGDAKALGYFGYT